MAEPPRRTHVFEAVEITAPRRAPADRSGGGGGVVLQEFVEAPRQEFVDDARRAAVAPPLAVARPLESPHQVVMVELQQDIDRIKAELDSAVYTDEVEDEVIRILRKWSERGTLRSGYLDWIFDALQLPRVGLLRTSTYFDLMLDTFDRADEVRTIRDGTIRYRGRESAAETERRREERARREEIDQLADLAGHWAENTYEPYVLPSTPQNLAILVDRVVGRLQRIPDERLTPKERAMSNYVRTQGPRALLVQPHFVTESERAERRAAALRAVAAPLLEIALWMTAEKLAAMALEAILARLVEGTAARAAAGVISRPTDEAGRALGALTGPETSALGRLGAREGEAAVAAEASVVAPGPGFEYRITSLNPKTGDATAIGRNLRTGDAVAVQLNVDTGIGVATLLETGEMVSIRAGRLGALPRRLPGAGAAAEVSPIAPLLPDVPVWVNRQSGIFHPPSSAQWRTVEQDVARKSHWVKMSAVEAVKQGYRASRSGLEAIRAEGIRRVEEFLADYLAGGRLRNFGAAANPLEVYREVTLFLRDAKGHYVEGSGVIGNTIERGRRLDVVDLTDPQAKKVFEIGTATPSTSEILRKEGQRDIWEQIGADAEDLVDSGYDGKIWGRLPDGRFVDLTGAEYLEIPLP